VADDVPAGFLGRGRKQCVGAGDVFLWSQGVHLEFGFAAFIGDGEQARAMDGTGSPAQARKGDAKLEPQGIYQVEREEKGERKAEDSQRRDGSGRRVANWSGQHSIGGSSLPFFFGGGTWDLSLSSFQLLKENGFLPSLPARMARIPERATEKLGEVRWNGSERVRRWLLWRGPVWWGGTRNRQFD